MTRCEWCTRYRVCVNGVCADCRDRDDDDHADAHAREDAEWR